MKCSYCGAEHELLDPTYRRPQPYVELTPEQAASHSKASDDLCRIELPGGTPRFFVRGTLAVPVQGVPDGVYWGFWAELAADDFRRVLALWEDPDQGAADPMPATLANRVASYPETMGLPLELRMSDLESRPKLAFVGPSEHPLVIECRSGVNVHTVNDWLLLVRGGH